MRKSWFKNLKKLINGEETTKVAKEPKGKPTPNKSKRGNKKKS